MSYFWATEGKFLIRNQLAKRYTNGAKFTIAPEVLKDGEAIDYPSLPVDGLHVSKTLKTCSHCLVCLYPHTFRPNMAVQLFTSATWHFRLHLCIVVYGGQANFGRWEEIHLSQRKVIGPSESAQTERSVICYQAVPNSNLRRIQTTLTQDFHALPQSSQAHAGVMPSFRPRLHFPPHPFQFIIIIINYYYYLIVHRCTFFSYS